MPRYIALIDYDPEAKAFGAIVPDCSGCTAMGVTFDEVEANIIDALREWCADYVSDGTPFPQARDAVTLRMDHGLSDDFTPTAVLVMIPVYLDGGRPVRVNVSMEAGLVEEIDAAAKLRGLTRSGFLASAARDKIAFDRGAPSSGS